MLRYTFAKTYITGHLAGLTVTDSWIGDGIYKAEFLGKVGCTYRDFSGAQFRYDAVTFEEVS